MLSRHAEGLFWAGRYLERTADITKLLDAAYHAQIERHDHERHEVWEGLLRALYQDAAFAERFGRRPTTELINQFLVFDAAMPSSVASSVRSMRTNIMNMRDIVPIELLEAVNVAHERVLSGSLETLAAESPSLVYEIVVGDCRSISGVIADVMSRTDGYRYLMVGRLLERAEMTARMIDVTRHIEPGDPTGWVSLLRSVSGWHAFTRTFGPLASGDEVVSFLLTDTTFPFGVLHCLENANELINEVRGAGEWKSPNRLGQVTSSLRFTDIPEVGSDDLGRLIHDLERGIREAAEALHTDLFQFGGLPAMFSFDAR